MARKLGKDTITIVEPGDKTDHGKTADDWDNPTSTTTVEGCYVELSVSAEDLVHRDASRAAGTAFAPAGTPCSPRAKVVYAGVDYRVDGRALAARGYTGSIDYLGIPIDNWEG